MRGYSFRQAIDAGCEPRSYDSPVPEGACLARLDFKIWGKHGALRCFFTELETGTKFSLPAFRFHQGQDIGQYSPRDLDTPHIHVLLVPLDGRGKLNCRALFGGSKHTLSALQTDYAQAVASIGIERGIENSRAEHQKVSQYYTLTQPRAAPELPLPRTFNSPEMPNKVMRMSDERLALYARQTS